MRTIIGQTLLFGRGGNADEYQLYGWSEAEPGHTWSIGTESALCLPTPESRLGYFLEIYWFPFVSQPFLPAQPLTIRTNRQRIFSGDVRLEEVAAFRCPPAGDGERQLVITFEHADASRPCDFGAEDYRQLAIAFRRLRLLPIIEGSFADGYRKSHHRLQAQDIVELGAEAEQAAGVSMSRLLSRFEMLAGNCDMGTVQRAFGVEPLSLLRFAGAYPSVSIKGLDTRFEGIGESLEPWEAGREWMMRDQYGLNYHTGQPAAEISAIEIIEMERKRVSFLRRKFLEDLAEAEKIFVADRTGSALSNILPLYLALNRHGSRRLLWIVATTELANSGAVQEVLPGLFMGYLYQFGAPMVGHVTVRGWLEILVNAWLLTQGEQQVG
jgi:hypothetical protein